MPYHNPDHTALNPSFKIDCGLFDITKKESKNYYSLFVRKKACFPNNTRKLKSESETMQHFFYDCSYSIAFWKGFELYYLLLTKQLIYLDLKDILIGCLTPELPLLNNLLLMGKIYLWACRRNKELPSIQGFKSKVKLKYETEKYICTKKNLDLFRKKWTI